MKKWIFALLVAAIMLPQVAWADTVILRESKNTFDGLIIYQSEKTGKVCLDIGTGRLWFQLKDVIIQRNNKRGKAGTERVSFVTYGGSAKKTDKGKKAGKKVEKKNELKRKLAAAVKEKPEIVPAKTLVEIQQYARDIRRTRARIRNRAMTKLRKLAPQYPRTITALLLNDLTHSFPRIRRMVCVVIGYSGRKKLVEKLMPRLRDSDKWVRYEAGGALTRLSGNKVKYPMPEESLDQSITPEEKAVIIKWEQWYDDYKAQKLAAAMKKEKEEAARKSSGGQNTQELLRRLKQLLKEKGGN